VIDRFILSTGIVACDQEFDADAVEILIAHAEAFIRAGGHLSLSDWEGLSEDSKGAFVAAGNAVERDRAFMLSTAFQSRNHALHIAAENDGGAELVSEYLRAVMDVAEQKLRNGKPIKL